MQGDKIPAGKASRGPYGDDAWLQQTVRRLGLEYTTRREGRPSTKEAEEARTK